MFNIQKPVLMLSPKFPKATVVSDLNPTFKLDK